MFFATPDDAINLTYYASSAPTQLVAHALLRPLGGGPLKHLTVGPVTTFTSDRTRQTPIASGTRIPFDCEIVGGGIGGDLTGIKRGQVYALMTLANPSTSTLLCANYITDIKPFVTIDEIVDSGPGGGNGNIRTVTGTNPAAGAEASDAVPTNALWKMRSYTIVLVTSSQTANRDTALIIDDGTTANRRAIFRGATVQAASLTRTWAFTVGRLPENTAAQGVTDTDTINNYSSLPDPIDMLTETYRLRTLTTNLQTLDDYAAPIFQVEEWIVV